MPYTDRTCDLCYNHVPEDTGFSPGASHCGGLNLACRSCYTAWNTDTGDACADPHVRDQSWRRYCEENREAAALQKRCYHCEDQGPPAQMLRCFGAIYACPICLDHYEHENDEPETTFKEWSDSKSEIQAEKQHTEQHTLMGELVVQSVHVEQELRKVHAPCDCGAKAAGTTHSDWCSTKGI